MINIDSIEDDNMIQGMMCFKKRFLSNVYSCNEIVPERLIRVVKPRR